MQILDKLNSAWKLILIIIIIISAGSYILSVFTEMHYRQTVVEQLSNQNRALINILNECSKCYSSEF